MKYLIPQDKVEGLVKLGIKVETVCFSTASVPVEAANMLGLKRVDAGVIKDASFTAKKANGNGVREIKFKSSDYVKLLKSRSTGLNIGTAQYCAFELIRKELATYDDVTRADLIDALVKKKIFVNKQDASSVISVLFKKGYIAPRHA